VAWLARRHRLRPSRGGALADPGQEYLVLEPSGAAAPFTVLLEPGTYTVEWFGIEGRERFPGAATTVERATGGVRPHRPLLRRVGR
jgi:hypothetical protein